MQVVTHEFENRRRYGFVQNKLGYFWPLMEVMVSGKWCDIIIRDSNPFKTEAGARKFINQHVENWKIQTNQDAA